jgi:hypothetical protein
MSGVEAEVMSARSKRRDHIRKVDLDRRRTFSPHVKPIPGAATYSSPSIHRHQRVTDVILKFVARYDADDSHVTFL